MCTGSVTALLPVGQEQRFIVRSCVTCGVEFSQPVKKGRTRFACSKECRIEYLKLYNRSRISRKRQGIEPKRETVIEWSRCLGCGKLMAYAKAMQRKWCSDGCRDAWDADALKIERKRFESRPFTFKLSPNASRSRQYKKRTSAPCYSCGSVIILGIHGAKQYRYSGRVFCDNECGGLWKKTSYATNESKSVCTHKQQKAIEATLQARRWKRLKTNGPMEPICLAKLWIRHCGQCVMCKQMCNLHAKNNDPLQATRDHIVPVSKGGTHTWDNVQLLCRRCNCTVKGKQTYIVERFVG